MNFAKFLRTPVLQSTSVRATASKQCQEIKQNWTDEKIYKSDLRNI